MLKDEYQRQSIIERNKMNSSKDAGFICYSKEEVLEKMKKPHTTGDIFFNIQLLRTNEIFFDKDVKIDFRVSKYLKKQYQHLSNKTGVRMSDLARLSLYQQNYTFKDSAMDINTYHELKKIGNNFNQIAKALNTISNLINGEALLKTTVEISELKKQYKELNYIKKQIEKLINE